VIFRVDASSGFDVYRVPRGVHGPGDSADHPAGRSGGSRLGDLARDRLSLLSRLAGSGPQRDDGCRIRAIASERSAKTRWWSPAPTSLARPWWPSPAKSTSCWPESWWRRSAL